MSAHTNIVPGSLTAMSRQNGRSLAESFLSADCIVIVDVSASMSSRDARGSLSRYDVACDELAKLQNSLPGKIAVVSFSDAPQFAPGGQPTFAGASTDLTTALRFVYPADGTVKFVVISDGQPNDEATALAIAKTFTSKIDVIHIGPETDTSGRDFMRRLAGASGGQFVTAKKAQKLAQTVQTLMLAGGN